MSKKLLVMLTAMGTLSVTLVAAPIVKNVTAKIDPAISFNLNGEKVMKDSEALMYNDTLYLPVRALGDTLDAGIEYKDKVVYITTEETNEVATANTKEVSAPVEDATPALETIAEAKIIEVDVTGNQVTLLPAGLEDIYTNYIILNISEESVLKQDNTVITLEDLEEGMRISATHSPLSTRSMPPQTAAFTLTVFTEAKPVAPLANETLEDIQVVEVTETKDGYQVLVGPNASPEDLMQQTILLVSKETVIKHEKDKSIYTAADLKKGMKITAVHKPIMTMSIPGQTPTVEITILAE